jgi:hypothetical protein
MTYELLEQQVLMGKHVNLTPVICAYILARWLILDFQAGNLHVSGPKTPPHGGDFHADPWYRIRVGYTWDEPGLWPIPKYSVPGHVGTSNPDMAVSKTVDSDERTPGAARAHVGHMSIGDRVNQ